MPVTEPVLCKRIPTAPWGDPKDRHIVGYDEYVKTDGYETLRAALDMTPEALVGMVKDAPLRGRGGAGRQRRRPHRRGGHLPLPRSDPQRPPLARPVEP